MKDLQSLVTLPLVLKHLRQYGMVIDIMIDRYFHVRNYDSLL